MTNRLTHEWSETLAVTDPSLVVATADGRLIPSAEYYDEALSIWGSNDPYIQITELEDFKAGRGYGAAKQQPLSGRDVDLFIRRPVVPSAELTQVLTVVAPFHNPNRGIRCHKPGIDRENGFHTTLLNTRGLQIEELPDQELFEPSRRVPSLAQGLGKMMLEDVDLFEGDTNFHVVLLFGHKAIQKLRRERDGLEQAHFPGLSLQSRADTQVFRPHVTVVSSRDQAIAEQALKAIRSRTTPLKSIDLAPAKHTFYQTKYAD